MSSYKLSDFDTAVDYRLKQSGDGASTDALTTAIIDAIIQTDAVVFHSKFKPYKKTADVSAGNSYLVTINNTNFPGWIDGFSDITFIEYPADEYQDPSDAEIPPEDWQYYEKSSIKYVRFLVDTPSTGTIRFSYTVKHSIAAAAADTLFYDNDFGAFCDLAAAICCRSIAAKFGFFTDSTMGADAVEYRNKSDVWASRAKNFLDSYMAFMFPDEVSPAFARREFDTMFSAINEQRLTHPASSR